jgi:RHS repeat-associated protein
VDASGSTSLTTDAGGGFKARVLYYPYGEERYVEGTLTTDYQYTGQRKEGFGLYDYSARYYDPYLARFVSADTIVPEAGNSQALDRYAYVANNPLKYTDPSGHRACLSWDENGQCTAWENPANGEVKEAMSPLEQWFMEAGYYRHWEWSQFRLAYRSGLAQAKAIGVSPTSYAAIPWIAAGMADALVPGGRTGEVFRGTKEWNNAFNNIDNSLQTKTPMLEAGLAQQQAQWEMQMTFVFLAPGADAYWDFSPGEGGDYPAFDLPPKSGMRRWSGEKLPDEVGPITSKGWGPRGASPESGSGGYWKEETHEGLRIDYSDEHGPHWDYHNRVTGERTRVYPNGHGGGWVEDK